MHFKSRASEMQANKWIQDFSRDNNGGECCVRPLKTAAETTVVNDLKLSEFGLLLKYKIVVFCFI